MSPALVKVAGYEAWCQECGDGSGVTDHEMANIWARNHNGRVHPRPPYRGTKTIGERIRDGDVRA